MKTIIKGGRVVNRGEIKTADVLLQNGRIERIDSVIDTPAKREINAEGHYILPGIIDDQVHFRQPGLTHKADLTTEPRAAVAGGVTSYMEMPNTKPPAITQEKLEEKYMAAARQSLANYSFYMGTSNDNLEEVLKTDLETVCGVKIFMGSSTGNMLVDEPSTLEQLFAKTPSLIATHCEDEATIRNNLEWFKSRLGEDIAMDLHPEIRNAEGCYRSSSMAVELAKKHGTRLHILHLSTADEMPLFDKEIPRTKKRITAEVCVHHLYFNRDDYARLGSQIKCNPAIKEAEHQAALLPALLEGRLDVIATDHAPHTWEEKQGKYLDAPSGLPLIQHPLNIMLELEQQGKIDLPTIVDKMCHAPADLFLLQDRGYLDEGFWADVVVLDPEVNWTVSKENIYYKCGWSPFEGHTFKGKVKATFVSGHLAYQNGQFDESQKGMRLRFGKDRMV